MIPVADWTPLLLDAGQHLSHGILMFCSTLLLAAWLERTLLFVFFTLHISRSPRPLPRAAARGLYGVFAWIGGIAPMAGLLGTVTGIMLSFTGHGGQPDDQDRMMRGVGLALSATAVGLLLAMAALSGRAVFGRRTEELEQRAERSAG